MRKQLTESRLQVAFILNLFVKFSCSIIYAYFIFNRSYESPDSLFFFEGCKNYLTFLKANPELWIKTFNLSAREHFQIGLSQESFAYMQTTLGYETSLFFIKLSSPIVWLTGQSYIITNVVFGALSATFSWLLFLQLKFKLPEYFLVLALAILFLPSTNFWCTGYSKDSVIFWCICAGSLCIYFNKNAYKWIGLIISSFVFVKLKLLLFISFFIGWIYYLFSSLAKKTSQSIKQQVLLISLCITISGTLYLSITSLGYFKELAPTQLLYQLDKAKQSSSERAAQLNKVEKTKQLFTKASAIPKAISKAYFSPYFFSKSTNSFSVFNKLEALLFQLAFIYILANCLLKRKVNTSKIFYSLLITCIASGVLLGLPDFQLGSLIRYRAPVYPFLALLFVLSIKPVNQQTLV